MTKAEPKIETSIFIDTITNASNSKQFDSIKEVNVEGAKTLAIAYEQALKHYVDPIKLSAVQLPGMQAALKITKENMAKAIGTIPSLRVNLDHLSSTLANIQLDTLMISKSIQSPLTETLRKSIEAMDYGSALKAISNCFSQRYISANDLSFLKNSKLVEALQDEISYPYGLKTAIAELNQSTAKLLETDLKLKFDLSSRMFVKIDETNEENNTGASANEINVIYSARDAFNSITDCNANNALEEEFITEIELMDFMNVLFNMPTRAGNNPTGEKIFNKLKSVWDNKGENIIGFDKTHYYHSRSRDADTAPFVMEEMLKAPTGMPGPGRYNYPGRAHYYFADTVEGARNEVKKHLKKNQEIQTIKILPITEMKIKILDLSSTLKQGATFLRYIRFPFTSDQSNMPREYLIPNFVADCCKAIGFEGIKYYGSKSYSNYVCWNDGYFSFGGNE